MQQHFHRRQNICRQAEGGYLLLAILLMMAFMIIAAAYIVGPRVVQQIKRDREEEMIHRGTEYMRAIKKFYKKNGRYPASLDDLDKGQIRYLRQRYKDPLTKDGKWKLLNYGDIQTLLNSAAPGTPAAQLGQQGQQGALGAGGAILPGGTSALGFQQQSGSQSGFQVNSGQGSNSESSSFSNTGFQVNSGQGSEGTPGSNSGFQVNSGQGSNAEGLNGQSPFGFNNQPGGGPGGQQGNSPFGQNTGNNQQFGGGAIVGVASMSNDPTIRIYNKKKKYSEWQFIYNPMMDQQNVLLRGPYQPTTIGSAQIGTPAGQLNGQQQNGQGGLGQQSPFGQQGGLGSQSGFGQQPGNSGPYQPRPLQPGNNYPPDQNSPQ